MIRYDAVLDEALCGDQLDDARLEYHAAHPTFSRPPSDKSIASRKCFASLTASPPPTTEPFCAASGH
ncbi:hypothetical protein PG993_015024 [Apiospora rasikravindrae]|uniref:Uncharacterized protein n=1 Tax=Apiospora rasikravindrae TaxID=990691 RepID=A0ABR1RQW0_9PEZI